MSNTREKILNAAMSVFFEKGYEEASVRMILEKADVTTGSIYHFFASKEELFEEVIKLYLLEYTKRVEEIFTDGSLSVSDRINAYFAELEKRMQGYYSRLHGDRLHWTIQCALHEKTIAAVFPCFERLVSDAVESGLAVCRMHTDTKTVAAVLIKGTEAILHCAHERSVKIDDVKNSVMEFAGLIFEIKASR